jgi:hypothetical protein
MDGSTLSHIKIHISQISISIKFSLPVINIVLMFFFNTKINTTNMFLLIADFSLAELINIFNFNRKDILFRYLAGLTLTHTSLNEKIFLPLVAKSHF